MLAPFLSGLVFAMFMALVQDGVDQVVDCDEFPYLMPELVGLGGGCFAFLLKPPALCLPGFYREGFMEAGEFTFGQVEAAEFCLVVLLKLFPAFFEFDLLQLVMDWLGLDISLRMAL